MGIVSEMIETFIISLIMPPFIMADIPDDLRGEYSSFLNQGDVVENLVVNNAWNLVVEYADNLFDIHSQSYVYEIREYDDYYHILFASEIDRNETDPRPLFANASVLCEKNSENCLITTFNY